MKFYALSVNITKGSLLHHSVVGRSPAPGRSQLFSDLKAVTIIRICAYTVQFFEEVDEVKIL